MAVYVLGHNQEGGQKQKIISHIHLDNVFCCDTAEGMAFFVIIRSRLQWPDYQLVFNCQTKYRKQETKDAR